MRPPRLLSGPAAIYPILAQQSKIHGMVVIEAIIDERGNVIDLVSALRKSLEASKAAEPKAGNAPKGPPPKKGPPQPASKATRKRA